MLQLLPGGTGRAAGARFSWFHPWLILVPVLAVPDGRDQHSRGGSCPPGRRRRPAGLPAGTAPLLALPLAVAWHVLVLVRGARGTAAAFQVERGSAEQHGGA